MKSLPQFFALAVTALIAGSASAAQVWVAPAAQKIRPSVQPAAGAPTAASIAAAQNEFESFQVVVTGAASGVSMSIEGLNDGKGHTISGRDLVLYREALLNVLSQTGGDGAAGMWPDALVPDVDPIAGEKRNAFPFDVPAGESRAVLVDVPAPARLKGAKLTSLAVNGPQAANAAQVKAWHDHVAAKGWTSTTLFDYVCDEPPLTCAWSDVNPRISQARAGDASVATLVTTTTDEAKAQGVSGIDLYTPVVNYVDGKPGSGQFAGNQRAKYGSNVWWYQSCMSFGCSAVGGGRDGTGESGWPTYAVDSDATRNRAMEWMSYSYNMPGELYYETTIAYFTGDPWVTQANFGGTGDGTLFYPGTPATTTNSGGSTSGGNGGATDCTTTACTGSGSTGTTTKVAGTGSAGGCSSSGVQSAWLAIPALALFALSRRRRRALVKVGR